MEQPELSIRERAARARRRALRAAQVVTMSAALAGTGAIAGCSMSHANVDGGGESDAGPIAVDAGNPDCVTYEDAQESEECCELQYGWWEDGRCLIAVEGPRVPPPMPA